MRDHLEALCQMLRDKSNGGEMERVDRRGAYRAIDIDELDVIRAHAEAALTLLVQSGGPGRATFDAGPLVSGNDGSAV